MKVMRNALLWGSQNRWLEEQFRRRRFAKKAVSKFIPGESVGDALRAARELRERGLDSILTRLGENVTSAAEVNEVVQHYHEVLDRIGQSELHTHISIKLTQLGLDLDRDATNANLASLVQHAAEKNNFVWIDMEYSHYVDATLQIFHRTRTKWDNVGVCLQAYLYRTKRDLTKLLEADAVVRLVKGAYAESPDVAFPKKSDVDANYLKLAQLLLEHRAQTPGPPHAIATHDMKLINAVQAKQAGGWEVDMLYGIASGEQKRLVAAGHPVRVLVSYGEAWFAWYMRRLAERPANVGFVLRSMVRS